MSPDQKNSEYRHLRTSDSLSVDWKSYSRHRTIWERLGSHNISVLLISLLGNFLAVALLAQLWQGAFIANSGGSPTSLWLNIYNNGWAARIVTTSSVLVRAAATAQMGVFAAITAAIMLENNNVGFRQLPLISMIRTINNGPLSHIWNMLDTVRSPSISGYVYCAVLTVAILNLLALQFASTILLSDFGEGSLVVQNSSAVPYISDGVLLDWVQNPWQSPAILLPRFAEILESNSTTGDGYVDTGKALRAFLPLSRPEDRQNMTSYSGPANVINARTICVRPIIEFTDISIQDNGYTIEESDSYWNPVTITVEGHLPENIPHPAINLSNASKQFFSCKLEESFYPYPESISLCSLSTVNPPSSYGELDSTQEAHFVADKTVPQGIGSLAEMYLVSNFTSGRADARDDGDKLVPLQDPSTWKNSSMGPWSTLVAPRKGDFAPFTMNMTLCFAAGQSGDFNISAHGASTKEETKLSFTSPNPNPNATLEYHTESIRNRLNAVTNVSDPNHRSLFELNRVSDWTAVKDETYDFARLNAQSAFWGADGKDRLLNQDVTKHLFAEESKSIHHTLRAIFLHALRETNDPSKALQALLTIVSQNVYHQMVEYTSDTAPAEYYKNTYGNFPVRWTGFIIVMAMLGTNTILVIASLFLFAKTEHSLLRNAWQPMAQVATGEAREIVLSAAYSTDKEMDKVLDERGCKRKLVVLRE